MVAMPWPVESAPSQYPIAHDAGFTWPRYARPMSVPSSQIPNLMSEVWDESHVAISSRVADASNG